MSGGKKAGLSFLIAPLLLCALFLHALPTYGQHPKVLLESRRGTLRRIDAGKGELEIAGESGTGAWFRTDERLTLVFRGINSLSLSELRPGMCVEVDYRPAAGNEPPVLTWIEVLPRPRETGAARKQANGS